MKKIHGVGMLLLLCGALNFLSNVCSAAVKRIDVSSDNESDVQEREIVREKHRKKKDQSRRDMLKKWISHHKKLVITTCLVPLTIALFLKKNVRAILIAPGSTASESVGFSSHKNDGLAHREKNDPLFKLPQDKIIRQSDLDKAFLGMSEDQFYQKLLEYYKNTWKPKNLGVAEPVYKWYLKHAHLVAKDAAADNVIANHKDTGTWEVKTIKEWEELLKTHANTSSVHTGKASFEILRHADVREIQGDPKNKGSVVQIASNFTAIEGGATHYDEDNMYRYSKHDFPVGRHLTCMADVAAQGEQATISTWWGSMYKYYFAPPINLLCKTDATFEVDERYLTKKGGFASRDTLRKKARSHEVDYRKLAENIQVGIHKNVQVTSAFAPSAERTRMCKLLDDPAQRIDQVFTAVMDFPQLDNTEEVTLAKTLIQASYKGTILATILAGKKKVFLTLMGGGAFKNRLDWIAQAIEEQKDLIKKYGLEVVLVYWPKQEELYEHENAQFEESIGKLAKEINSHV